MKKILHSKIERFCYEKKYQAIFVTAMVPIIKEFYLKETNAMLKTLFEEIKHGDKDHQDWLKNKIKIFYENNIYNG